MNKYSFTKTFTYDDSNIIDVISTFEDVFFEILKNGQAVELIDVEDDEEVWELTMEKLLHGMQMAVEQNYWDGDIDSLDGEAGDIIFQFALFDEIVFG